MQISKTRLLIWHLSGSAGVVGLFIGLVLLVWCPPPLGAALGLGTVLWVLLGVDVVLGPALGFALLKPQRASFRFDFAVIVLLQLLAFAYGAYTVFNGRPAYLVFSVDRFEITVASQIAPTELAKVQVPQFQSIPLSGPQFVYALVPQDRQERERILFAALGGADLHVFPQHYQPYAKHGSEVLAKAKPLYELEALNGRRSGEITEWLRERGVGADQVRFVPLAGKKRDLTVLIDAVTGAPLEILDLVPW